MVTLLAEAFEQASRLPESEQEELARWILEELSLMQSQAIPAEPTPSLREMLEEARKAHKEGRTQELDPDTL
jgi:hypothetical protein